MTPATEFHQRLQKAIKEGAAARRALIHHAAGLPTDKLQSLSPDILRLLGSSGLAEALSKRSADALDSKVLPQVQHLPTKRKKTPLIFLLVAISALTALGPALEHVVVAFAPTGDDSRSIVTTHWPACPRLDRSVDGCLYTVGGGGDLTLLDAASRLGLTAENFVSLNAHIQQPVTTELPRGSQLVVWRGKIKLELEGMS